MTGTVVTVTRVANTVEVPGGIVTMLDRRVSVVTAGIQGPPISSVDGGNVFIVTPANITIPLVSYSPYEFDIEQIFNLKTSEGTIDLSLQINGVDIEGLSNITVSSVAQSPVASSNNEVAIGDRVTMILFNNAAAKNLEFTTKGLR